MKVQPRYDAPRVRVVRCPRCAKVHSQPWDWPYDRSPVLRFDWPRAWCYDCKLNLAAEQALKDRLEAGWGDRPREPGIDGPEVAGEEPGYTPPFLPGQDGAPPPP